MYIWTYIVSITLKYHQNPHYRWTATPTRLLWKRTWFKRLSYCAGISSLLVHHYCKRKRKLNKLKRTFFYFFFELKWIDSQWEKLLNSYKYVWYIRKLYICIVLLLLWNVSWKTKNVRVPSGLVTHIYMMKKKLFINT